MERSLYLNLAQGYLKLGEPERALRACVVVLQEDATNGKALFRAAEACLAMKHLDKAGDWLAKLLEAEPAHVEAKRLMQRVETERRGEARKQKAAARRMLGACEGFSEGRETVSQSALPDSVAHTLNRMEPDNLCRGVDIAEAVARAARERETAMNSRGSEKLPEPTVVDLDAFRAKVTAKTQRFSKYIDRSKKQREKVGHGLKLAWLRSGQDAADLGDFKDTLQQEANAIEAADLAAAEAEAQEDLAPEAGEIEAVAGAECKVELGDDPGSCFMAEMD